MSEVIHGELHLAAISHKGARDALRQAAAMAAQGDMVWIVRRDGTRIAAVVSVDQAGALIRTGKPPSRAR